MSTVILKYRYYHYNTGSADNGTFYGEQKFATVNEALKAQAQIQRLIEIYEANCRRGVGLAEPEPPEPTEEEMLLEYDCFGGHGDGHFTECLGIFCRNTQEIRLDA